MTVCTSVLCENKSAVILASDRMVTDNRIPIEYESTESKFTTFPNSKPPFALTSAGSALTPGTLTPRVSYNIDDADSIEQVASIVKQVFLQIRRGKFEDTVLAPRGFTMETFYSDGIFNTSRGQQLDAKIDEFALNLRIIVAGVDGTGAHTFRIADPQDQEVAGCMESFDELGFDAIGSGATLARDSLTGWYRTGLSKKEALYITIAALDRAAQAPGVGAEVDVCIAAPVEIGGEIQNVINSIPRQTIEAYTEIYREKEEKREIPEDLPDLN